MRILGSRLGSAASGGRTGPQLIAAAKGSAGAKRLLEKAPIAKVQNLLIGAVRGDPIKPGAPPFSLLEAMLEKAQSASVQEHITRQVHAYAIQSGVFLTEDYLIEGEQPSR